MRVCLKSQLLAALRQRVRPIVIEEDHDLVRPFGRLLRARRAIGGNDVLFELISPSYSLKIAAWRDLRHDFCATGVARRSRPEDDDAAAPI